MKGSGWKRSLATEGAKEVSSAPASTNGNELLPSPAIAHKQFLL